MCIYPFVGLHATNGLVGKLPHCLIRLVLSEEITSHIYFFKIIIFYFFKNKKKNTICLGLSEKEYQEF